MQSVTSSILAVLLGIHAVLGCSWERAPSRLAAAGSCCRDRDCDEHQGSPQQPLKCRGECGGICSYLPPQRTLFDAFALDVSLARQVEAASVNFITAATTFAPFGQSRYGPPLPLHLLHQRLLI